MTILFAGSGAGDFKAYKTPSLTPYTSVGTIYSGVKEGFQFLRSADVGADISLPSKVTDLWIGFYCYPLSEFLGSGGSRNFVQFFDTVYSKTVSLLDYECYVTTGNQVKAYNGTTRVDLGAAAGSVLPQASLSRVDVHLKIDDVAGVAEVYRDGLLQYSFTGDTLLVANAGIDRIRFLGTVTGGGGGNGVILSAIVVSDEDTRGMYLCQSLITGNGAHADWEGSYTAIDEIGINDDDFISSAVLGSISTFTHSAIPVAFQTGYDVEAVVVAARGVATPVDKPDLEVVARVGGVDYPSGSKLGLSTGLSAMNLSLALNPATGLPWTIAEVDAAEFGIKLVASA